MKNSPNFMLRYTLTHKRSLQYVDKALYLGFMGFESFFLIEKNVLIFPHFTTVLSEKVIAFLQYRPDYITNFVFIVFLSYNYYTNICLCSNILAHFTINIYEH